MLVIGHRGAAGSAPENSLEALRHGASVGADMLEFDVQVTRDKVPIVVHDSNLLRTHRKATWIRWTTNESIQRAAAKGHKIALLEEIMEEFFGQVYLNLELKTRLSAKTTLKFIAENYIEKDEDWDNILFSSFYVSELEYIRRRYPRAAISLLHKNNPFGYIAHHRRLHFDAVGFKRSHMNRLALEIAHRAGVFTYVYTVNRPASLRQLEESGVDAIVTDYPDRMIQALGVNR